MCIRDRYVATVDDDGVQLHQYASATIHARIGGGREVALRMETGYPADGRLRVTVVASPETPWTLTLRVPAWAQGAQIAVGGERRTVEPGYATVTRLFALCLLYTSPSPRD